MKRFALVVLMVFVLSSTALAGSLPHTFTSGTQAKASEVNANFAYLENLISALTASLTNQAVSPGTVVAFAGSTPPAGWLLCDGESYNKSAYPELFDAIGYTHGGDLSSSFNVPDYRGRFLRGVDGTADRDPDKESRTAMNDGGLTGNKVGSVQEDQIKSHNHTGFYFKNTSGVDGSGTPDASIGTSGQADTPILRSSSASVGSTGGSETRPDNAYVNWIIKY